MTRVLLIDDAGDGLLDIGLRAQSLGHQVRYFLRAFDLIKRPVGAGLINRVNDWREWIRWADLTILGGNGRYLNEIERWQREGYPIIGGNPESASWELDRRKGMAVFKQARIPIPAYQECRRYDDAIRTAANEDRGFAVKPCGDVSDKSLSFVAKTAREMVWRLERWKKEGKRFDQGFILQDRINGVEMAVGGWFGPQGFAPGIEENWEEKRLFAGALGPNCGEAGTVMRLVKRSKLADKVLLPLEEQLDACGYVGNIDVNCIIDEDGNPWPLEFTMRLGYPAINIESALHADMVDYLAGLAAGDPPRTRLTEKIAVGVVAAIPPYPFGHERPGETVNVPIWGVTPSMAAQLHFCDVMAGEAPLVCDGQIGREPMLATAGSYVLVATGIDDAVTKARAGAERVLNRLTIPASPFWRNDIGERLRGQLPKLQAHGYAKGMNYA